MFLRYCLGGFLEFILDSPILDSFVLDSFVLDSLRKFHFATFIASCIVPSNMSQIQSIDSRVLSCILCRRHGESLTIHELYEFICQRDGLSPDSCRSKKSRYLATLFDEHQFHQTPLQPTSHLSKHNTYKLLSATHTYDSGI
jgi:hypothetical protein